MIEYPILVEGYDVEHPGDIVICSGCHAVEEWDPGAGDPEDWGALCDRCGGKLFFKYQEADRCPSCKELGFYGHLPTKGCCSRVCMLQKEYADSLKL